MHEPPAAARPCHCPPAAVRETSQWADFTRWAGRELGRCLDDDRLQAWAVQDYRAFWRLFLRWCGPPGPFAGAAEPVCEGASCESARFFPGLRLNYAACLLDERVAPDSLGAVTACDAQGRRRRWTRGALRQRVATLADAMARRGLGPGDRVAAVLRNDDLAVQVALAVTAVGATLSTASPDMGIDALADRFEPLAPRWLIAHAAARALDAEADLPQRLAALAARLPSAQVRVWLEGEPAPGAPDGQNLGLETLLAEGEAERFDWPRWPFNHPLFILFSSGTTGRPKCIVHGAGGSLLEHLKEHRLHTDLRPGDRMYFHTSCSWMMWNWQLSALASGVEIVARDGPVPATDGLWQLVAQERVTVFGTSPAYLRMCQDAGLQPRHAFDLSALRAVLSTGAILHDGQYAWVREQVGDLPLQSISGGTDILGCFVLGHPHRPVYPGQAQCRSLAMDVQAWQEGRAVQDGVAQVGELVCINPFPSRPLGFHGDPDGSRFHTAYFSRHPGVWTHGDLIEFTAQGGARLHGRCDGVLNVRGIKIAPAEIYRVLEDEPGIRQALVVQPPGPLQASAATSSQPSPLLWALLVLQAGERLDDARIRSLRRTIARRLSAAHVPDRFVAVAELPMTHSGKLSEAAAAAALAGWPVAQAQALRNPQSLRALTALACSLESVRPEDAAVAAGGPGGPTRQPGAGTGPMLSSSPAAVLQALWQEHLGLQEARPDDHFFDLGGNSLLAARIAGRLQAITGRCLPLAAFLRSPTLRQLSAELQVSPEARADATDATDQALTPAHSASPQAVPLRAGQGAPVFLVHGLSGTVMECWPLVTALRTPRPLFGLQACGLDGEAAPMQSVAAIADHHLPALRARQPRGPYALCGFSFGGLVALEMARRLRGAGEAIELLCLLDSYVCRDLRAPWATLARWRQGLSRLAGLPPADRLAYLRQQATRLQARCLGQSRQQPSLRPGWWDGMTPAQQAVYAGLESALQAFRPEPYDGSPVVYVRARLPLEGYVDPMPVWRRVARAGLQVVRAPGSHLELVGANGRFVAGVIDRALGETPSRDAGGPSQSAFRLAGGTP